MATLQHLPYGFAKNVLGSPCRQTPFNLDPLDDIRSLNSTLLPSKQTQIVVQQLRDTIDACRAFTHELTEVCNSGIRVSQCLASAFRELNETTSGCRLTRDVVEHFSDTWKRLATVTQNVIASLEQRPFTTLQETLAEMEMNPFNVNAPADESNKILLASFLTIVHLQYQFSLSVCESFVDIINGDLVKNTKTRENVDDEMIDTIQKHFYSFVSKLQSTRSNCVETTNAAEQNKPKNRAYRGWPRSSSLDSATPNVNNGTKTWSLNSDNWPENSSLESLWSYSIPRDSAGDKNSGFATSNELQAVVGLLSYQTSDAAANVWSNVEKPQRSILKKPGESKLSGTWPRSGIWSIYSDDTTLLPNEEKCQFHANPAVNPCYSMAEAYNHVRTTKSTSWPVANRSSENQPSDSNSSSDEGNLTQNENSFFMGLELVGNDLMASVRQRRHSSGSMLPDLANNASCSSIRTKSIDSITVEEKSRLSVWQNNVANCSRNGKIEEHVDNGNALWSLPPSGADSRKPKLERKYSLFGC